MPRRECRAVCLLAPAKVNLFLEILGKRPDGFHELETFMVAVDLYDRLECELDESGSLVVECDTPEVPAGSENLVWKAAEVLRQATACRWGARIRLLKRIPLQAGLAGGSTDAAATLKALNRLWNLELPTSELARLGASLGSDVPFFFAPGAAWCTGRGETVEPWFMRQPLHLVLICPGFGLSTPAVYGRLQVPATPQSSRAMRHALSLADPEQLGQCLHNRLQEPAESLAPVLRRFLERVAQERPAGYVMSGSGSAVVALCRDRSEAIRVAKSLRADIMESSWLTAATSQLPALRAGSHVQVHVVRSCP